MSVVCCCACGRNTKINKTKVGAKRNGNGLQSGWVRRTRTTTLQLLGSIFSCLFGTSVDFKINKISEEDNRRIHFMAFYPPNGMTINNSLLLLAEQQENRKTRTSHVGRRTVENETSPRDLYIRGTVRARCLPSLCSRFYRQQRQRAQP